jgi:phage terminase small subunit
MLTAKQEKFAQCIIEGKSQADAYRIAYPKQKCSNKTIWENASRIYNSTKVQARIKELRDQLAKPAIMSAQERLEYLTRVIKGEQQEKLVQVVNGEVVEIDAPSALKTKLNAIDIMNKMQGEYVQRVEADVKNDITISVELTDE